MEINIQGKGTRGLNADFPMSSSRQMEFARVLNSKLKEMQRG